MRRRRTVSQMERTRSRPLIKLGIISAKGKGGMRRNTRDSSSRIHSVQSLDRKAVWASLR